MSDKNPTDPKARVVEVVCPRCIKTLSQFEQAMGHTCTPTNDWRNMETEIERLRSALEEIGNAVSGRIFDANDPILKAFELARQALAHKEG